MRRNPSGFCPTRQNGILYFYHPSHPYRCTTLTSPHSFNAIPMLDPHLSPKQFVVASIHYPGKVKMEDISQSADSREIYNESRRDPMATTSNQASHGPVQRTGRWTPDEKILFLYGLKRFGKGRWKKMSVYLPHRSLVQIKSHAQKVLKRMEAGENVFRRLEENYSLVDNLVVQAAKQHEAITGTPHSPKSTMAKRKKQSDNDFMDRSSPQSFSPIYSCGESGPEPPIDGDVAALAASALCQLSSLPS